MRRDHGFTLMEIIVAVVVLGFVLAGLAQASHFGIYAWNAQTREAARVAEMERVDRVLRLLINETAAPLAADDKDEFVGEEHRFQVVTRLPDQPPTDPVRRAQVAVGVDSEHRLLLRWQPHPNAVALKTLPPPQQIVLAEGVDHLDMRYRQAAGDGGKWSTRWNDASLPALVQMNIVLQNEHRVWPVIQAATMLDSNGSF
jgi:general secretion pathway protein J